MEKLTVQEMLKDALSDSGLRQADLARQLGVNQATISTNMRRDKIGVGVMLKLLDAMGYSVAVGKETINGFEPKWIVK